MEGGQAWAASVLSGNGSRASKRKREMSQGELGKRRQQPNRHGATPFSPAAGAAETATASDGGGVAVGGARSGLRSRSGRPRSPSRWRRPAGGAGTPSRR